MLGKSSYPRAYIEACHARLETQITAFSKYGNPELESVFFNNMVIVLEGYFVHRTRKDEGKDGNALNEVRVLAASMMLNGEVMGSDPTITLDPDKSVLGYAIGDTIALSETDFARLAGAFFAQLELRFAETDNTDD